MADGSDVQWPSGVEWKPVGTKPPKPAKAPPPEAAFAVGEKGGVTLTIGADLLARLRWKVDSALALDAIEADGEVFLRLSLAKEGVFRVQAPPRIPASVADMRCIVRLYRCGGIKLGPRKSVGVPFKAVGDVLFLNVPRLAAALAPSAQAAQTGGLDGQSMIEFALDAVLKAWPQASRDGQPTRIAAGVALVEFGMAREAVREALGLSRLILPEREDMPLPARKAATAALEALREAAE